ncbi:alanine racemase [Candidatus Bathyarchaeota archaeon]|nr:alanine racemase [Candidatus Bathyarchaeota archaeon]
MSSYFTKQPSEQQIGEKIKGFSSWLEIDLDAIEHNIEQVRKRTGVEIIPCVKSNAYGHGIVPIVAYYMDLGIKKVLVAKLSEAMQLRESGLDIGVVSIDPIFSDIDYKVVVENKITQTIYQRESAKRLNEAAKKAGKKTSIWVKIDTGLGRVGIRWNEAVDFIEEISVFENLRLDGVFSTLSEADELDKIQVQRILDVEKECNKRGIDVGTKSIASSNAVFHKPYTYLDATRPGLMLTGFHPEDADLNQGIELKQSLCWKARIEHVKNVEKGEALTYSRRFVASKPMKVGTVHIGYYDGFPRGLTMKGKIRVGTKIKDVLGTVSVNHFLVDLTDTDYDVGDIIEAISREGENSALNVANLAGIMTYSLGNGLHILTPRVYRQGGKLVALSNPRLVE